MERIRRTVAPDDTAETAAESLAGNASTVEHLAALSRNHRSNLRAQMKRDGYSNAVIETVLPRLPNYRGVAQPRTGPFTKIPGPLAGPAREAIAAAVGLTLAQLDALPDFKNWTREMAAAGSQAVTDLYPRNLFTRMTMLSRWRAALREGEAPEDVRDAAAPAPELAAEFKAVTRDHLDEQTARAEGVPEEFSTVRRLRTIAEEFIAGAPLAPLHVVALQVIFAARPGEVDRITVGPRGGLPPRINGGILKKKDAAQSFEIVSALGADLAANYLDAYNSRSASEKARAAKGVPDLLRAWGVTGHAPRKWGAFLATRAAALEGRGNTAAALEDVRRGALRHARPDKEPATRHYAGVFDPAHQLGAQVAEAPEDIRRQILELLARAAA